MLQHGHERFFSTGHESAIYGRENDGKERVSVKNEELFSEQRKRAFERAARAKQDVAIDRISNVDAELRTVSYRILDHFAKVADTHHDTANALVAQVPQLP